MSSPRIERRILPAILGGLALLACPGDASCVVYAQDAGVAEWADQAESRSGADQQGASESNAANSSTRTPIEREEAADAVDFTGDARRPSWNWAWAPIALAFGLWWLVNRLRRGKPRDNQLLPEGVIVSLGRRSIGGGHVVQLIRIGSRILVVTPTTEGLRTLTDITNSEEVERLISMCLQPANGTTGIAGLFSGRAIRAESGERTARTSRDEPLRQQARSDESKPELLREAAR
jgi:hypothetical protein